MASTKKKKNKNKKLKIILSLLIVLLIAIVIFIAISQEEPGGVVSLQPTPTPVSTSQSPSPSGVPIQNPDATQITDVYPGEGKQIIVSDRQALGINLSNALSPESIKVQVLPTLDFKLIPDQNSNNIFYISPTVGWKLGVNYQITISTRELNNPLEITDHVINFQPTLSTGDSVLEEGGLPPADFFD